MFNKPAGLVVHPGAGQQDSTILNALLYRYPELAKVPRAGIIHRLDKDTTGLLVIAKNLIAHTKLITAMQKHQIKREYIAIVNGTMTAGGTINAPIGRHRTKRTLMAVVDDGKPAITHYRVLQRFPSHTLIQVILETGRTHQIRVHMAHLHHSIIGDQAYSRLKLPAKASQYLCDALKNLKRQALHAKKLGLPHPNTGVFMQWEIENPEDIQLLIKALT